MARKNTNLHAAKTAKNDEFYTQLTDIEKELKYYKQHFEGKTVLCNCDDPTWSEFWRYFHLNFEELGLKKLISTHYDSNQSTYKLEYAGGDDNNIEAGVQTPLTGNGDFRSEECVALLDEADIVVTNPPFSLFREYIAQLIDHDKKFIIIGNINAITYKEIFPLIKDNKMWMGMTMNGVGQHWFRVPKDYNHGKTKIEGGIKFATIGNACWFTNIENKKRNEKLILYATYAKEKYPKYDNYDAINVDKVVNIPIDYTGKIGVPIGFLNCYNPTQFEILGEMASTKVDEYNFGYPYIDGKKKYARLIIQAKKV